MSASPAIRTAMLVDDSALDRLLHRRVLERSGQIGHVLDVDGAEAALACLHRREREGLAPVELILLDVHMPRIDGFGFLDRAVARWGTGFVAGLVVMLTTSSDPADLARADGLDVVGGYLAKPLAPEDVSTLARRIGAARVARRRSTARRSARSLRTTPRWP